MTKTPVTGYQPVKNLQRLAKIPNVVCRIVKSNKTTPNDGTGFLIGNGLLMTCSHVLPSKDECLKSQAIFFHTHQKKEFRVRFDPGACFINSPSPGSRPTENDQLDFTIVALDLSDNQVGQRVGEISRYAIHLFNGKIPRKNMVTHIFQHPYEKNVETQGVESNLRYSKGVVTKVRPPRFTYTNKTNRASSGSPIVGEDGELLGLHRAANEGVILNIICRALRIDEIGKIKAYWGEAPPPSISALQKALRTRYSRDDFKFLPEFIPSSEPIPIGQHFTQLSIIPKEEQKKREKKGKDCSNTNKDSLRKLFDRMHKTQLNIEIPDLFTTSKSKKILILGRAGIGKSTLCQKIAYDWGRGKLWNQLFDFVYFLRLRDIDEAFLKSCVSQSGNEFLSGVIAKYSLKEEMGKSVWSQMADNKNSSLLILDGYDEANELLKKRLRPIMQSSKFSILLTSRPEAAFSLHKLFKVQVENMGFTEKHVKKYIYRYFTNKSEALSFYNFLKSKINYFAIAHIPLHLEILCNLWEEGQNEFPTTLTELMEEMVENLYERQCNKEHTESTSISEDEKNKLYSLLGKIALKGLEKNRLLIDKRSYTQSLKGTGLAIKDLHKSGLLKFTENRKMIYFLHLTYQEYMIALMLSKQSTQIQKKFVLNHLDQPHFRLIIRMLTSLLGKPLLQWIFETDLSPVFGNVKSRPCAV